MEKHSIQMWLTKKLIQFFASKNQTFCESGVMKMTEEWQTVIEQNGPYIIE